MIAPFVSVENRVSLGYTSSFACHTPGSVSDNTIGNNGNYVWMPTLGNGTNKACYINSQSGYSFKSQNQTVSCPNLYKVGMGLHREINSPDLCITKGYCWSGFADNGTSACFLPESQFQLSPLRTQASYTNYSGQFQIVSQSYSNFTSAIFGLSAVNNSRFGIVGGDSRQTYQWGLRNSKTIISNNSLCLFANVSALSVTEMACNQYNPFQQWVVFNDSSLSPVGNPGMCLFASPPSAAVLNGTLMTSPVLMPCNGGSGQLWQLLPHRSPRLSQQSGLFYIGSMLDSKTVIDQYFFNTTAGRSLQLHSKTATANQFFSWTTEGNLVMLNGGLCLSK
jgi:hypothetical protein